MVPNVGIGTSTPGAKLEVAGQVKITGGTPGAGKILTSDASGLASWSTPSGTTQWTTSASDIYYNTGNVGIGTTTPSYPLTVAGNTIGLGNGLIEFNSSYPGKVSVGYNNTTGAKSNIVAIGSSNNVGWQNSVAVGRSNSTGNADDSMAIGIGNSTTGDSAILIGRDNSIGMVNGYPVAVGYGNTVSATGAIALGNGITNSTASSLMIGPSDAAKMTILSSGNVGIGATNPSSILDVNGAYTQRGMAAPAVSNSGEGRIYFDSTTNKFMVSQHGGGYVDLVPSGGGIGGSGTSGKVPKFTASGTIGDSLLADTGSVVTVENYLSLEGSGAGGHSYITNTATSNISLVTDNANLAVIASGSINANVTSAGSFNVAAPGNTKLTLNSGGGMNLWSMTTDYNTSGNLNITQTAGTQGSVIANRSIASTTNPIASGAAIDLSTSNTHTLASVGGSAISLSNMVDGGVYNIAIEDTTSRTYTFSGCTNSYYKPANAATTASTRTIYGVMTVKKGANWDCYVTWSTGFQ